MELPATGVVGCRELKVDCAQWQQSTKHLIAEVTEAALRAIVHWCGIRVLESAEARRAERPAGVP